jgi:hypothetical protein
MKQQILFVFFFCYLEIMASALSATGIKRKLPSENTNGNQAKTSHWSVGLSAALDDENARLFKDDLCTVIKDKYPKVC